MMHFVETIFASVRISFVLITYIILSVEAWSQTAGGARSASLAGASVAIKDGWSIVNNQAGMAFQEKPSIGLAYEAPFMINSYGTQQVYGILPTQATVLGISYERTGITEFHSNKAGVAFARVFGERTGVGLQLDYLWLAINEYENPGGLLTFELGIHHQFKSGLSLGIHVFHPVPYPFDPVAPSRPQSILRTGIFLPLSEQLNIAAEIESRIDHPAFFKLGVEYMPSQRFQIRGGISAWPFIIAFGAGIRAGHFQFDIASSLHWELGLSPQLSLQYNL